LVFIDGKKLSKNHYHDPDEDVVVTVGLEAITDTDLDLVVNPDHRERIREMLCRWCRIVCASVLARRKLASQMAGTCPKRFTVLR